MKKLGLVGGIGPESTIPYYHDIVYGVKERVGKNFFPNITIESINVFEVLRLCKEQNYEDLVNYLSLAINNLSAAGAEFAALTGNTPHIVFEELKARSPIQLVSIVDAAADEAEQKGLKRLGLIGTEVTMKGDFFKRPFIANGIDIIVPAAEINYINEKIANELEIGIVRQETQQEFMKIIEKMQQEENAQALILGCTELPLLFKNISANILLLDTMKIHVNKLIDMILEE